jgi:putative ABC transport system permease protein
MNVFKIAWRSIQHRGLGSLLTIISMALGVMMVVTVLTVHGMVSRAFNDNSNFGYNILVGARGGELQLAFSSVYYLASPVENVPYEYYLAFCDEETRNQELKNSIAWAAYEHESSALKLASGVSSDGGSSLLDAVFEHSVAFQQESRMGINTGGMHDGWTHTAVPINLGDFWVDEETGAAFRCVATKPAFFTKMVISIDPEKKFEFSQGRCFEEFNQEHGHYEAVIGETVARKSGLKIGDTIQPTHGDPNAPGSHIHETDFHIVGILDRTGTANDRALFLNMEGFFLMEGHAKTLEDDSVLGKAAAARDKKAREEFEGKTEDDAASERAIAGDGDQIDETGSSDSRWLEPLQMEKREVTSILVRTIVADDGTDTVGFILPAVINEGGLETSLDWSSFRPEKAQKAAQAINPVMTVTSLFSSFVDPIRWVLLALTLMICVVSAIGILVGIYNSMSQRRHEIAVIRALGASRQKVMGIMLCEAMLMALLAGLLGWAAGHGLNAALGPIIEERTNVQVGFFDFAPKIPLANFWGGRFLPNWAMEWSISPEFLVVPGMIVLAILVGIYPAISAYQTDVSKSLGK